MQKQLMQVVAVDLDSGNNARLIYRLYGVDGVAIDEHISPEQSCPFAVRSQDGWLYVRGALDRESKELYELTVTATDAGDSGAALTATTKITVLIADVNDNDPR